MRAAPAGWSIDQGDYIHDDCPQVKAEIAAGADLEFEDPPEGYVENGVLTCTWCGTAVTV